MSAVNASVFIAPGDTVAAHVHDSIVTLTLDSGTARFVVFVADRLSFEQKREWLASLALAANSASEALEFAEFSRTGLPS